MQDGCASLILSCLPLPFLHIHEINRRVHHVEFAGREVRVVLEECLARQDRECGEAPLIAQPHMLCCDIAVRDGRSFGGIREPRIRA